MGHGNGLPLYHQKDPYRLGLGTRATELANWIYTRTKLFKPLNIKNERGPRAKVQGHDGIQTKICHCLYAISSNPWGPSPSQKNNSQPIYLANCFGFGLRNEEFSLPFTFLNFDSFQCSMSHLCIF